MSPPRHCPTCGHDLSEHPYYQLVPSPFARRLQWLARFLIPVMTVVFLVQVFRGDAPLFMSPSSGYSILAYVLSPSLFVYGVSSLMPRMRRVICLRCSWYRDYFYRWGTFSSAAQAEGDAVKG